MVFKINLSEKSGKTFKIESESEQLVGKSLHDKIEGNEISPELNGYEFEIAGASDSAGFPSRENVEGVGLKKVLLRFGKDMKKRPKREGKRKMTDWILSPHYSGLGNPFQLCECHGFRKNIRRIKMAGTWHFFTDDEVVGLDTELVAMLDRARGLAGLAARIERVGV